ncbi:MAG: aromatic amino acid ammonia-lyase, partial [Patescibacteria group bacterium]
VYGVNTGVGDLCDVFLSDSKLLKLQENLIMSHACGSEPYFDDNIARGAQLLVINARAKGYSGLMEGTIQKLITLFNHDIVPLLPMQGSLGASGDLIPLAHLALPLLGEGNVRIKGKRVPAKQVLQKLGIAHALAPKEALGLINGTEVTTSQSAFVVWGAERLLLGSLRATAALFEIFGSGISSLDPDIHALKQHMGQAAVVRYLRGYLRGSALVNQPKAKAQDPYVIRCAPQIDGAILGEITRAKTTVEIELNSVTDNPLFFTKGKIVKAVSGGNFHAQALAFALDGLGIALTAASKLIERRVERLLNSSLSGLPPFLVLESGLNSGLMIPHYLIAALVAENSVLAHPASIQTVSVSANQEDYVSMAMTSATKAASILRNTERILAIELLLIAQAMDVMVEKKNITLSLFSASARSVHETVRRSVAMLKRDRLMSGDIDAVLKHLRNGDFLLS